MSIKVMNRVWEQSTQQDGTLRLLLLALADHASDDGVCWPGIDRLARKIAKTRRHTRRLLSNLEESGELFINRQWGRGHTNLYLITIGQNADEIKPTLMRRFEIEVKAACQLAHELVAKRDAHAPFLAEKEDTCDTFSGEKEDAHAPVSPPVKEDMGVRKGDTQGKKGTPASVKEDIAMSPEPKEPSLNHQEPSGGAAALETEPTPPVEEKQPRQPRQPRQRRQRRRSKTPPPPAAQVYRSVAHLYPAKSWYATLDQVIGCEQVDLDFWREVVHAYIGLGWNKRNVKTMLEYYQRREIPVLRSQRNNSWRQPQGNEPAGFAAIRELAIEEGWGDG